MEADTRPAQSKRQVKVFYRGWMPRGQQYWLKLVDNGEELGTALYYGDETKARGAAAAWLAGDQLIAVIEEG